MCRRSSTPPAASPGARRCRNFPISSRRMSRCGPRWSKRPALRPIEALKRIEDLAMGSDWLPEIRHFQAENWLYRSTRTAPAWSPSGGIRRIYRFWKPVILAMPAVFASILQRIRSFSLSIGQMTFGSFLTLLAVITATSMASVIAIRHIDSTFDELQRLQDVGAIAAAIDRRMNELRLAARDCVTDPGLR